MARLYGISSPEYATGKDQYDAYLAVRSRFFAAPPKIKTSPKVVRIVIEEEKPKKLGRPRLIPAHLTITSDIVKAVSTAFGVPPEDVMGRSRCAGPVLTRMVAIALAKHFTNRSLPDLGSRFGRDHTTILNAIKVMQPVMNLVKPNMVVDATFDQWATAIRTAMLEGNKCQNNIKLIPTWGRTWLNRGLVSTSIGPMSELNG